MGLHGFPPISPLSAAYTLVSWAEMHGRFPMATECRPAQGLHHWNVYYRALHCSTFSGVVSAAIDLVSAALSAAPVKMRTCLGSDCDARFPDVGPHIRLCPQCRKHRGMEPAMAGTVRRVELKRWGADLRHWDEEMA